MKTKTSITVCLVAFLTLATPVGAQENATIVETETHSVFTGLFRSVWAQLKSLNPKNGGDASAEVIYTAGIRGAESTDTLLKPYWKGDLTRDEAFQAELQQYSLAQLKMDRGELEAAIVQFDGFLEQYADSSLRPNALLGKGISLAGIGNKQQSAATLRLFVDEYPNHPLADDAGKVIESLI